MNSVFLIGNLTRKPELRFVGEKKVAVANFSVAVNRYFKNAKGEREQEVTFVDCEAWATGAENMEKWLDKGNKVALTGSLKQESWEKDGQKHTKLKLRVENFENLSPRKDTPAEGTTETPEKAPAKAKPKKAEAESEKMEEDIPF
jgi:single-strand DNA-binding protein